jgi:hypothetical protein
VADDAAAGGGNPQEERAAAGLLATNEGVQNKGGQRHIAWASLLPLVRTGLGPPTNPTVSRVRHIGVALRGHATALFPKAFVPLSRIKSCSGKGLTWSRETLCLPGTCLAANDPLGGPCGGTTMDICARQTDRLQSDCLAGGAFAEAVRRRAPPSITRREKVRQSSAYGSNTSHPLSFHPPSQSSYQTLNTHARSPPTVAPEASLGRRSKTETLEDGNCF